MNEPVVLVTRAMPGPFDVSGARVRVLGEGLASRDDVLRGVRGARVLASMFTDRVDGELLDAAGPSLGLVAHYAAGYDSIDLAACAARGVLVSHTPDVVTESTADLAFALLLAVARRVVEADRYARGDDYPSRGQLGMGDLLGLDLSGKTLLLVGAGRIALGVARRSMGWNMRVLYVARSQHAEIEAEPLRASRVDLEAGLREADVVSLHTPLSDQTRHMIGARELALLRPHAIIINTARGPVIDERALADAIERRAIYGAGLDVFEREPHIEPRLRSSSHVVLTPHIGSAASESRLRQTAMVAANIRAFLAGKPLPNPVPGFSALPR